MLLPDAEFVHATDKAILFRWKGAEAWFPRSQVVTWPESWQKISAFSALTATTEPKYGPTLEVKDFMAEKAGISADGIKPPSATARKEDNQRRELARLQAENAELRVQVQTARQAQGQSDRARIQALQDVQRLEAELRTLRSPVARNQAPAAKVAPAYAVPPAKNAEPAPVQPLQTQEPPTRDWSLLETE